MKFLVSFILLISIFGIDAFRSDCRCTGYVNFESQNEILRGEYKQRLPPWHAQIQFKVYKGITSYFCGGVFLNEYTVLTAASCLPPLILKNSTEYWNRFEVTTISGAILSSKIENIFLHPNYKSINQTWALNDIAIVKLETRIDFASGYREPGCLNFEKVENYGQLKVAGFGHEEAVEMLDNHYLHFDPLKRYNFKESDVEDQTHYLCSENKDQSICIGDLNPGVGTPLYKEKDNKLHIVGINSKVFKTDYDKRHSVFCISGSSATRLSAYKEFIEQHVGDNYCSL